MTKKQAIEILNATLSKYDFDDQPRAALVADLQEDLDRAGAFPSEATLAEIDAVSASVFRCERASLEPGVDVWRNAALRLASACRAAGLVK